MAGLTGYARVYRDRQLAPESVLRSMHCAEVPFYLPVPNAAARPGALTVRLDARLRWRRPRGLAGLRGC